MRIFNAKINDVTASGLRKRFFRKKRVVLIQTAVIALLVFLAFFISLEKSERITVDEGTLSGLLWVKGMEGCENICLEKDLSGFYATDLSGSLYRAAGNPSVGYEIAEKVELGRYALGIAAGNDGRLYAGAGGADWLKTGGSVLRMEKNALSGGYEKITRDYPGLNGLCMDREGDLYFTTGNFNYIRPEGSIYKMELNGKGEYDKPVVLLSGLRSANGLYYSEKEDALFFTEVFMGVKKYVIGTGKTEKIFGKSRLIEGFDDLCIDSSGNIWVADPPSGSIKRYDSQGKKVTCYAFLDFGVASSCRTGISGGREYIFISEIRQKGSKEYDGRGVMVLPLASLPGIEQ